MGEERLKVQAAEERCDVDLRLFLTKGGKLLDTGLIAVK